MCNVIEKLNKKAAEHAAATICREIALRLLAKGMPIPEVAEVTQLSEMEVRRLAGE